MRHFIILLISTSLLFSCNNVDIAHFRAFPDVKTVANKLDAEYRIMGSKKVYFTLAKKPKGWYVVRMDSKTIKPLSEVLFWSSRSHTYERIPRDLFYSTESTGEIKKVADEIGRDNYNFDHSIYFGYEGWEEDVINDIGGNKNLNDTLLESLARAYGSICLNLTRYEKDPVAKRSGKISDAKLEDFCKFGNKDIETYRRLLEANPEYETMVGKTKTKLSNEHMFLWAELKQSGRDKEAEQFLADGLYDELLINFSKNMLNSAEKDAIIFTNGDNDTYPLWYVQQKLGVRKDVAILNTSLLNIPSWIFSGRDNYNFNLEISEKFYNDSLSDVIYLANTRENIFGMSTVKEGVENRDQLFIAKSSDGDDIFQFPFSNVRLSYVDNDSLAPVADLKRAYLLKSDLAIFDIISSNLGKRPIYFAQTAVYGSIAGVISRNLLLEGMLAHIVQGENTGTFFQDKYYDLDLSRRNFLDQYNYGIDNVKSFQVESIAINYIYSFNTLSCAFLESGDTAKALEVAEACLKKIPFSKFTEPVGPYLIGDDLCRSGKIEAGHPLYSMAYERIKKLLPTEKDEFELGRYSSILNLISDASLKYGFRDLGDPCMELKKKVDDKLSRITEGRN